MAQARENLLKEWILPKTLSSGCFGTNAVLEDFTIDNTAKASDQFASEVIFARLSVKREGEAESKKYDVFIKVELQNEVYRQIVNSTMQFQNEIFMYGTMLPLLDRDDIVEEVFCKYYYGYFDPDDPSKDFVVLEDLRKFGYRIATEPVFLDYDHCSLAMKQLGKFHALSYLAKQTRPEELLAAVSKIQEKWTEDKLASMKKMFFLCGKRGIQPFIDKGESVELLTSVLNEFKDPARLFYNLIRPDEPEAVLCHGDFNRNNVLYKYDENRKPVGIKLIDLQTPKYSSPVIDLSFFLFMNTTHSLREQHLNDLLSVYERSVIETTCDDRIVPKLDFGRKAIYGYLHSSYFLPCMLNKDAIDDILITDAEECARRNAQRGGEAATKLLVDIIEDLLHFGYIRKIYS